jgi:hypothetical protein
MFGQRSGDELEGANVGGTDHTEVASVEGGDASDPMILGNGDNRRVDQPEPEVVVGVPCLSG